MQTMGLAESLRIAGIPPRNLRPARVPTEAPETDGQISEMATNQSRREPATARDQIGVPIDKLAEYYKEGGG